MKNLINTLRENLDIPEYLFLVGMACLYAGSAAQFGHPAALIVCGIVLIGVALAVSFRSAK